MAANVLITGASRGIGYAIAEEMAKEGYHLNLVCRQQTGKLADYAADLTGRYGIKVQAYQADISSEKEVQRLCRILPKIDICINNAGISYTGLLQDMSSADWHKVMDTNLTGIFYICRELIPEMIKRQSGRILNISSVWGEHGASMEVAYSASKGGVNAFTKALAKELAPSHIPVNALACGYIDTEMNNEYTEEDVAAICEEIPCGRIGEPSEVAQAALKILQMPEYMTGQIITLDGGWQV